MDKTLKSMYKDIINNRNIEENVPDFLSNVTDRYHTYAAVRLALHYYTCFEMYLDEKKDIETQLSEYIKRVNTIISEAVLEHKGSEERSDYIRQIDAIRKEIVARMEMVSCYIDLFEIYEYALNRVEYRFKETAPVGEDEDFAREILKHIFDSEDNAIINERIKEIIGQLPIRITKQKYFEYIHDGLMELDGVQADVLETYIYMIRSSALLNVSEDMKAAYPALWESKEKLEALDFKNITKEEYEAATKLIRDGAPVLETETTVCYSLAEIINEVYTLLVGALYKEKDSAESDKQMKAAISIIQKINAMFLNDMQKEPAQEMLSSFEVLEGFQESMEYDLISFEDGLYHIDRHHRAQIKSMGKEEQLDRLLMETKLLSGSLFIDLDKKNTDGAVDRKRLQEVTDQLMKDIEDKFQSTDRMIIRAIMAQTINQLPVFFKNHTEVMEYVLYSLSKCTDLAEKYACREIIESMMEV